MNDKSLLKLDLLGKLKKMGQLNPTTANLLLLDPKRAAELVARAGVVHEMLFSPFPRPDDSVDGDIKFANTENQGPVGININNLLQGLIIGSPGSGKSILTYHIALQAMAQGVICWMFVKGNDAEKLIRFNNNLLVDNFNGQIPKNLLPPPPNYPRDDWNSIHWDIFIQAITLYDGTKNFLTEQYFDLYEKYKVHNAEPSFYEVYDFLKTKKIPGYSRDAGYKQSALNRIGGMIKGSLRKDLDCSSSHLQDFVYQNTIFNYKGLSSEASVYFINALIAWLAAYKEVNETKKTHLIILDDAMHVFDANRLDKRPDMGIGYINHILFETRKYKIKFLVDIQIPSLISKGILGTSNFKCLLNIPNANEIKFVLDILGVHEKEQREYAQKLDSVAREMIVKVPSYPEAFLASIPEIPLARKMDLINISSEEKRENNKRILEKFSKVTPRIPYHDLVQLNFEAAKQNSTATNHSPVQPKKTSTNKTDSGLTVLFDIYNRFDVTSTQRATDLGLSAQVSNKIYKYLEKDGFVEAIYLNLTGKRGGLSRFNIITKKGCELINKKPSKQSGGTGPIHHFIQLFYKKHLPSKGFKELVIEKNIGGKRIDIFGKYNGLNVGIEVCSSTIKTEHINVQKDLGKCDVLIIVTPDKKTKDKLDKELYKKIDTNEKVKTCVVHELLNDPENVINQS
jgi:hypothetical protein